ERHHGVGEGAAPADLVMAADELRIGHAESLGLEHVAQAASLGQQPERQTAVARGRSEPPHSDADAFLPQLPPHAPLRRALAALPDERGDLRWGKLKAAGGFWTPFLLVWRIS